jgi:hypothetical protein
VTDRFADIRATYITIWQYCLQTSRSGPANLCFVGGHLYKHALKTKYSLIFISYLSDYYYNDIIIHINDIIQVFSNKFHLIRSQLNKSVLQASQLLEETSNFRVEKFGLPLPVLITEALTFADSK